MKKLLFTLIFVTAVFSTVSAVCAEESVALPSFDVTFSSEKVESEQRQFPLIVYKDITYVPMTYYDCRYLGLSTMWDDATRTLSIEQTPINCAYRDYKWEWKNSKNNKASVCDFNIVVNGKIIDNSKEEYPLLTFRDVTYFPLTWRFAVDEFGWEYSFDAENGLIIKAKNYRTENVTLPNITGSVATDGEYYYYSGEQDGKKVVLAAADTFRAAAADQLSVWADRAKVRIIKHAEGSDASAVVFDAIESAKAKNTSFEEDVSRETKTDGLSSAHLSLHGRPPKHG